MTISNISTCLPEKYCGVICGDLYMSLAPATHGFPGQRYVECVHFFFSCVPFANFDLDQPTSKSKLAKDTHPLMMERRINVIVWYSMILHYLLATKISNIRMVCHSLNKSICQICHLFCWQLRDQLLLFRIKRLFDNRNFCPFKTPTQKRETFVCICVSTYLWHCSSQTGNMIWKQYFDFKAILE